MEERIKERFHSTILEEALRRYGVTPDRARLLDGFESFMYEMERAGEACILRIGHSLHRDERLIQAEVDWINYLADGGASVARAILSATGRLVEPIDDGHGRQFLATAFVKARGQSPWKIGWTPELYETYGQLIGRLHALSQRYQPSNPAWQRPQWDDTELLDVERFLPADQPIVLQKYRDLLAYLRALPKSIEAYGLIHGDAHGSNFFVDETGRITLFDFDDCAYSWYANDLAIVLFYLITNVPAAAEITRGFMPHFLRGYRRENQLDPIWLKELPHFLQLREIELYAVVHRSFDVEHIDNAWCAAFMQGRRARIEHAVPYVEFDFEALAGEL
ncbi:MAG TPA: phosphotransferase [Anaerolineae bacterium]|nr:phosphotransferase [Anaerolineae bacterium]